jgi:hypothetical protein
LSNETAPALQATPWLRRAAPRARQAVPEAPHKIGAQRVPSGSFASQIGVFELRRFQVASVATDSGVGVR